MSLEANKVRAAARALTRCTAVPERFQHYQKLAPASNRLRDRGVFIAYSETKMHVYCGLDQRHEDHMIAYLLFQKFGTASNWKQSQNMRDVIKENDGRLVYCRIADGLNAEQAKDLKAAIQATV